MNAEIMMIGTELLLGQIDDTNATYMAQELAANGINLYQKTTVGDNHARICDALNAALERCEVVLCSGGLGPTEDDITRECVAEVLGRPMDYHPDVFAHIERLFATHGFTLTENNKKQATAPEGATIVPNPNGTAPGLIVEDPRGTIICMPGVPHELKAMLSDTIIPYLRERFGLGGLIHYRVLKVCGFGESRVDAAIGDLINGLDNPTVGVLANPAFVRIRIAAKANSIEEADALIDPVDAQVRDRLPGLIMGVDDDTLEGVVDGLLAKRGWTLSVAETQSGGIIAQRLVAHRARQFLGGIVTAPDRLEPGDPGALALEMARKAMVGLSATCSLGVVGDPVQGRTVVAFVHPEGTERWEFGRTGRDERVQLRTCVFALEYVRRFLTGKGTNISI